MKNSNELIEKLKICEKKGLFDDFMCPKGHPNKINWRNEKINRDGLWYYCSACHWLDVIGMDIINDTVADK